MAITTGNPVVTLPMPKLRPWGLLQPALGLLDVERFQRGIQFQVWDFTPPEGVAVLANICTTMPEKDELREFTDVQTKAAFGFYDAIECSTLWKTPDEVNADVADRWPLIVSAALAAELLNGTLGGDSHSLVDDATTVTGSPSTVLAGIAELEEAMAVGLGNTQGMIHMTPSALAYATTNGVVKMRGDTLFSPGGHIVIADAGYQVAETTTTDLYGSGPIYYAISAPKPLSPLAHENIDFAYNKTRAIHEAWAVFAYNQDTVYTIEATKA